MREAGANEISEKLKEARHNAGITQEQLADQIMVSRVTVSHWENGRSLPDIASLIALSDLYHISLDELVKGDLKMKDRIVKDVKDQAALKSLVRSMLISTLIIAGIYFVSPIVGGGFKDFWQSAMPYILMGLYLAEFFAYEGSKEEDRDSRHSKDL